MRSRSRTPTVLILGALLPVAVGLSGCSLVKKQELEDQLATVRAQMREEMTQGDRETAASLNERIDGVETALSARLDGLARDLAAMEADFDARVEELETALRFDVPVYFGFDEDEVRQQDFPVLDRFAEVVSRYYPLSQITVEGFTDPAGSAEYNRLLGQRRAEAVASYLVSHGGLGQDQVRAVSYGEAQERQIVAGGHGPGEGGWQNRRVSLVIDHSGS